MVGGKPYVTGINIQQALLTLIEGEKVVPHRTRDSRSGCGPSARVISTRARCCSSARARFEALYDQVFKRVTSPTSRVKLPTETVLDDGRVEIREYFTLRHHFRRRICSTTACSRSSCRGSTTRSSSRICTRTCSAGSSLEHAGQRVQGLQELLQEVRDRSGDHRRRRRVASPMRPPRAPASVPVP